MKTIRELRKRVEKLEHTSATQSETMCELHKRNEELEHESATQSETIRELCKQNKELEHKLATHSETICELHKRNEELDKRNEELEHTSATQSETMCELQKQNEELEHESATQSETIREHCKQKEELEHTSATQSETIRAESEQLAVSRAQVDQLTQHIAARLRAPRTHSSPVSRLLSNLLGCMPIALPALAPQTIRVTPRWEWQFKAPDIWYPFFPEHHKQLERNAASGNSKTVLRIDSFSYEMDLSAKTQKNVETSRVRSIRRVDIPDPHALISRVLELEEAETALTEHQVLVIKLREEKAKCMSEIDVARAQTGKAQQEIGNLQQEVQQLQGDKKCQSDEICNLKSQVKNTAQVIPELRKIMHAWQQRGCPPQPALAAPLPDQTLVFALQGLLRSTSHHGSGGCAPMMAATVVYVREVHNLKLWRQFETKIGTMKEDYERADAPNRVMDESLSAISKALPWIPLTPVVNEVLLFHGVREDAVAEKIAAENFDFRVAHTDSLYGLGAYFTDQACKAYQYKGQGANTHCMLLSRVALGKAFTAKGPMFGHRRPPDDCDSIIAPVGIPNGTSHGTQQHREFVLFDRTQVYPMYALWYHT